MQNLDEAHPDSDDPTEAAEAVARPLDRDDQPSDPFILDAGRLG